ncbi:MULTISPECIES: response regulator [unclassified Roseitalea]|uniref:response regulator n=1 Tax=unclassified Roseitalea TaxID=2639107 RepID=UPI00273FB5BA|nr:MULTISPECIES: response regulator [unclassified Roseitalea]
MSLAARITPHIPLLRRFARALTGSQQAGDAYVAALLEALVADPSVFPESDDARVGLYRAFVALWSSLDVNLRGEQPGNMSNEGAERNLQAIAPLPRQAFLLTAVEGFDRQDSAEILGVSAGEVDRLIDQASRDIAQQVATSVLIIEDEPLIAMDVEAMVEELGHRVTGIARTHAEALAAFEKERPGIVLADIQLADGSSGLDAVNDILKSVDVPVIFITAFPERLLTGERPEPAYLVTKPFHPQTVGALISQALFFSQARQKAA